MPARNEWFPVASFKNARWQLPQSSAVRRGRSLLVARDARRIVHVGDRDGGGRKDVAPVAVGPRLDDAVAGAAGHAGERARVGDGDVGVHRAVDEQRRVMAAPAEAARLTSDLAAEAVYARAVDGVVEGCEC